MVESQNNNPANKEKKILSDVKNDTKLSNSYFSKFAKQIIQNSETRQTISANYLISEEKILSIVLKEAQLKDNINKQIYHLAYTLSKKLREQKNNFNRSGIVRSLLQEFTLSSDEGIALMCLAEALLRIPDKETRDLLIKDKIVNADWHTHIGHSQSIFINVITWGLLVTGKLVTKYDKKNLNNILTNLLQKSSQPIIRKAVLVAMKLMGEQFVTGENIEDALINATIMENKGFTYSYDMLGEAALTANDAHLYMNAYQNAINKIGKTSKNNNIYENPGISIKLSALHPRYSRNQYQRIIRELYPRLLTLILQANHYNIGVNIDAEESDKLEISLDILEKLCYEPQLSNWNGIGFVVQAYQKRSWYVIEEIIRLAQKSKHRLMIRLVKGAYWDTEIKKAQINGLMDYPVYTKKMHTDISYIACAKKLLSVPDLIYPQFATHNAHTLATIYYLAGENNFYLGQYEFQCLHGMGEALYQEVVGSNEDRKLNRPCRIYAPVGSHETLLAYLVRRLLENGANTSFVNKISNHNIPLETLLVNPIEKITSIDKSNKISNIKNNLIPLPRYLYGKNRLNSLGYDLSNEYTLSMMAKKLIKNNLYYKVIPIIDDDIQYTSHNEIHNRKIINPADILDIIGDVNESTPQDIEIAFNKAIKGFTSWKNTDYSYRVSILQNAAELMEKEFFNLMNILIREAGKTYNNALSEIREAIDFIRYYAQQLEENFNIKNNFSPLGIIICISPWNFPLAIFTGQITAAIASGNVVLAKPSEQTPIIAMLAVTILHKAGFPKNVLQLLPGKGSSVGTQLINDKRINGVMFTGSTTVAKLIQQNLCNMINNDKYHQIPFIAETGGINVMIVDSSALTEQVVNDIIFSAFDSSGQRCSALRMLCIQEEVADHTITMLKGAISEYHLNNPMQLSTDIGPLIDPNAKHNICKYIDNMSKNNSEIYQNSYNFDHNLDKQGNFIQPTIIEIKEFNELKNEIFGPVLHVLRYKRNNFEKLIEDINKSGYGLTLGLHTRIDSIISFVINNVHVGNIYVNRNMIGAVVGVQPFGGERLSGTGPKAGGPLYLYRLLSNYSNNILLNSIHAKHNHSDPQNYVQLQYDLNPFFALCNWATQEHNELLSKAIIHHSELTKRPLYYELNGPTGELNLYFLLPRRNILCLAETETDALLQLTVTLALGCQIIWPNLPIQQKLYSLLPSSITKAIRMIGNWKNTINMFDAVIFHGDCKKFKTICNIINTNHEAIVFVQGFKNGDYQILPEMLIYERTISINTAAVGGNTSLMTIEEE
uniref:Bifunctional protein PutA n=1 Tax=Candidatus Aschnera chinzeii TaxID=1485666 RepID=A0AAT9G431_9ENTR|nr:MAG: trifunctional transcriptional regulator/proline dehydrogenase/L-glutamate gamma-semialdehyde dehydrogenase [Candidatus Aschnera chinzeii]